MARSRLVRGVIAFEVFATAIGAFMGVAEGNLILGLMVMHAWLGLVILGAWLFFWVMGDL